MIKSQEDEDPEFKEDEDYEDSDQTEFEDEDTGFQVNDDDSLVTGLVMVEIHLHPNHWITITKRNILQCCSLILTKAVPALLK